MAQLFDEQNQKTSGTAKGAKKPRDEQIHRVKIEGINGRLMNESGLSRRTIYRCVRYYESLQIIERVHGLEARLNILNRVVKLTHKEVHTIAALAEAYPNDPITAHIGKNIREGKHERVKYFLKVVTAH